MNTHLWQFIDPYQPPKTSLQQSALLTTSSAKCMPLPPLPTQYTNSMKWKCTLKWQAE